MGCSNCFNGCSEILSDQCIKYTGVDIPSLNIQNGDSLKNVEDSLTQVLLTVLVGTGIKPLIDTETVCNVVKQYIPVCSNCGGPTLNEILQALMDAACDLQTQIDAIVADINTLEQTYTNPGCLTIVDTTTSVTHNVLQAVITKLCTVSTELAALVLDVDTNYVKIDEINNYIQAYLNNSGTSTLIKNKMIPYVVEEYYGPITGFDITGAGTGDWIDIYLCNGLNGTPDKRGRVAVGVTDNTMGGGTMSSAVDPGVAGNPLYTLEGVTGVNFVTLLTSQMPSHTHVINVTDPGHNHLLASLASGGSSLSPTNHIAFTSGGGGDPFPAYLLTGTATSPTAGLSNNSFTGITSTATSVGESQSHTNTQPGIGCYYIIYIPS